MFTGLFTTMLRAAQTANTTRSRKKSTVSRETQRHHQLAAPQEVDAKRSERICPECQEQMTLLHIDGQELDQCLSCRGIWFDQGELKAITGLVEDVPGLKYHSRPSRYHCPTCGEQMTEYVFVNPHNLLVDYCESCGGVYLEAGELDRALDIAEKYR